MGMGTAASEGGAGLSAILGHPDHHYRSLMARYQMGDAEAFDALYTQLRQDLEGYLAVFAGGFNDDLLTEVLLTVHRARQSYNPRRPFEPWLMAIVHHVVGARVCVVTKTSRWGGARHGRR